MKSIEIFDKYILNDDGSIFSKITNRYLTLTFNKHSQGIKIQLNTYGQKKTYWLHNLVAKYFLDDYNPTNDLIGFKDNDRSNCSIDNLYVKKFDRVKEIPDDEINIYFESQNPYMIVYGYLKKHNTFNKLKFNGSFEFDDLVQYLITLLHKRTLNYIYNHKENISFGNYAFSLFDRQFQSGDIYKLLQSYNGSFEIVDSFEYDFLPTSITRSEYLNTTYGKNTSLSHMYILNKI